jgi:hypothetical protein
VVEKVALLCTPTTFYGAVTLQGAASASAEGSKRNVKVFRKNAICRVDARDKMSFSAMQMVLPKESEREIQVLSIFSMSSLLCVCVSACILTMLCVFSEQLRLEADARREMENFADHMMSDKFTAGAVRKKIS